MKKNTLSGLLLFIVAAQGHAAVYTYTGNVIPGVADNITLTLTLDDALPANLLPGGPGGVFLTSITSLPGFSLSMTGGGLAFTHVAGNPILSGTLSASVSTDAVGAISLWQFGMSDLMGGNMLSTANPIFGDVQDTVVIDEVSSALSNNAGTWEFSESVSEVPAPAAAWLFGSGLIGLAGITRRKKA